MMLLVVYACTFNFIDLVQLFFDLKFPTLGYTYYIQRLIIRLYCGIEKRFYLFMTLQFWKPAALRLHYVYRDLQECIVGVNKYFLDAMSNVILQFLYSQLNI